MNLVMKDREPHRVVEWADT